MNLLSLSLESAPVCRARTQRPHLLAIFAAVLLAAGLAISASASDIPNGTLWYNGTLSGVNGLANEENTALGAGHFASVYDDFIVTDSVGWNVTALFSDNLENTNITGANWEIRQGVSEGNGGTLIASGTTSTPIVTKTGRSTYGYFESRVEVTGLNLFLPPGTYFLNVRPIGNSTGRSFCSVTNGAGAVGMPKGNNENAFFNSDYFNANFTATVNEGELRDYSMGVVGTAVSLRFETEKLPVQSLSQGRHSIISDLQMSGKAGTLLDRTAIGGFVSYTVPVKKPGTYHVNVKTKKTPARGIFKLSINGTNQGFPQDEYSSLPGYAILDLGTVTFARGGPQVFTFLVNGKNASSSAYSLDFDYIELIPTTRLETESLSVQALSGATHNFLTDVNLSGGAGTILNATGANQFVTYTVPVWQTGTYAVRMGLKTSPSNGTFQLAIDGVNQGFAQDEYFPTAAYGIRNLGTVTFTSVGNKAFQTLVTKRNASSSGYSLIFDYIDLIPTNRLETESLKVEAVTPVPAGIPSAKWLGKFADPVASEGAGSYFNATAPGNFITYTVPIVKAGTYHVIVGTQTKPNKGIFQLAVNNVYIGAPQDEYSPAVAYGSFDLGSVTFGVAGNYSFKFLVTGRNPNSAGYTLAFDYIELVP